MRLCSCVFTNVLHASFWLCVFVSYCIISYASFPAITMRFSGFASFCPIVLHASFGLCVFLMRPLSTPGEYLEIPVNLFYHHSPVPMGMGSRGASANLRQFQILEVFQESKSTPATSEQNVPQHWIIVFSNPRRSAAEAKPINNTSKFAQRNLLHIRRTYSRRCWCSLLCIPE